MKHATTASVETQDSQWLADMRREHEDEKRRSAELTREFDLGLMPFHFNNLVESGASLTNRTMLEVCAKCIDYVLINGHALNYNHRKIGTIHDLAFETKVTSRGRRFASAEDLPNLFFENKVPIYFPTLESLGITLTNAQHLRLRESVIYDIISREHAYSD
jgi:hypothetical protein